MVEMYLEIASLKSPNDYVAKLKREIKRLREAQYNFNSKYDCIDHAFNAALTAWHIIEVVAEFKGYNKNERDDWRNWAVSQAKNLELLHDIATKGKHFKVTRPKRDNGSMYDRMEVSETSKASPAFLPHNLNEPIIILFQEYVVVKIEISRKRENFYLF